MKINYKFKEIFEYKFKRKPREWTIESLHELYVRAYTRHMQKRQRYIDVMDRIVEEVQEFEKGKRKVYYTRSGSLMQIELEWKNEYNSWSTCRSPVIFSVEKNAHNRNKKLEFILSKEKEFELGELLHSMYDDDRQYHQIVERVLTEKLEKKLRKIYKGKNCPEVLTVDICGVKYNMICDPQTRYNNEYKKFRLVNEVSEVSI